MNAIFAPGSPPKVETGTTPQAYWNPYLVGFFLGLTLLATYLAAGRGLGATGAFSSVAAWLSSVFSPEHAQANYVHSRYLASGSPLTAWLIFLLIGSFIGAAASGLLAHRSAFIVEKGLRLSDAQRLWLAFAGGIIAALGAKVARGCTSGQALTGGSILNAGSLAFMAAVFAAAYAVAWMFKKEWL